MSKYRSYWFVNGNLHKFVQNVSGDIVETFDFEDKKYKRYYKAVWDSCKKTAYTIHDFVDFFGRSKSTIRQWAAAETIPRGHMAWSLINPDKPVAEFWTEEEVWDCWRHAKQIHRGRPRKDGEIKNSVLSRAELSAILNEESIVYIKRGGELIPVWKELT